MIYVYSIIYVRLGSEMIYSLDWFVGENLNRKPWSLPSKIGFSD